MVETIYLYWWSRWYICIVGRDDILYLWSIRYICIGGRDNISVLVDQLILFNHILIALFVTYSALQIQARHRMLSVKGVEMKILTDTCTSGSTTNAKYGCSVFMVTVKETVANQSTTNRHHSRQPVLNLFWLSKMYQPSMFLATIGRQLTHDETSWNMTLCYDQLAYDC